MILECKLAVTNGIPKISPTVRGALKYFVRNLNPQKHKKKDITQHTFVSIIEIVRSLWFQSMVSIQLVSFHQIDQKHHCLLLINPSWRWTVSKSSSFQKMPPKKEIDPDLKKGDLIQAVVISDPFNNKFGPLTTPSTPKVSLNLSCLKPFYKLACDVLTCFVPQNRSF